METRYLIKISAILLGSIGVLLLLDMVILQGGFFVKRLGVIPARARLVAGEVQETSSRINIRVKNFVIKTVHPDFFRKGQKVEVSCTIENSSSEPAKNFQSLIRIPGKDVAVEQRKLLKPGEEMVLSGTLVPETSGLLYLACRADPHGALFESNENDNHEIAALYVLPI